jgi:hypothetical protein
MAQPKISNTNNTESARNLLGGKFQFENLKIESPLPSTTSIRSTHLDTQMKSSHVEMSMYYSGENRSMLTEREIARVRELEARNDELQREIIRNELVLKQNPKESIALLAVIEHHIMMIAANTGEVLKIFIENKERSERAKDLESQNIKLLEDIGRYEAAFAIDHNMQTRTKLACDLSRSKSRHENNVREIKTLCTEY